MLTPYTRWYHKKSASIFDANSPPTISALHPWTALSLSHTMKYIAFDCQQALPRPTVSCVCVGHEILNLRWWLWQRWWDNSASRRSRSKIMCALLCRWLIWSIRQCCAFNSKLWRSGHASCYSSPKAVGSVVRLERWSWGNKHIPQIWLVDWNVVPRTW